MRVSRQTDEMHIQVKFKAHLDFSWFVPKRSPSSLSFFLSVSVYPVSFYSDAISLSIFLFFFDRSLPLRLTSTIIWLLSPSLASLSLPRWFSFWVGTCHLFFTSLSRVAESFSMEPWIMFMERNDKECYLRPMVTIARAKATGLYIFLGLLFSHGKRNFA